MFLSSFVVGESPQWEDGSKVSTFSVHGCIFIVFVIFELFLISVLDDHSFHDLKCSFHWCRVKWILNVLLLDLNWFLVFLVLHLFLKLKSLHILVGLHVWVKDHPLSSLKGEVGAHGRVCLHTFMTNRKIESLGRSLLKVKGVSNGSLLRFLIFLKSITTKLLIDDLVHSFEHDLFHSLLVVLIELLIHCIFRVSQENISIMLMMECKLVNLLINFEHSILEGESTDVLCSLRVFRIKSSQYGLFFLFSSQLKLVNSTYICLIHDI